MILRAVIFTHGPDFPSALIATAALERQGVEVWWAVDATETEVRPIGVRIVETVFDRRGNLNGIACVIGILEVLLKVGEGADWVLKVDSDTMVLSLAWLLHCVANMVGVTYPPMRGATGIFGLTYAIRPRCIPGLIVEAIGRGERAVVAEDMIMGELGESVGIQRHPFHAWKGVFSKWQWHTRGSIGSWIDRYQILSVQRKRGEAKPVARKRVAAMMHQIFKTKWP